MNLDRRTLGEKAKEMGFVRDTLEKVFRLTEILAFINSDSILSKNLILKGGTAINLMVFNLPRLSVDIDLDLAINYGLEEMLKVRETITEIISRYMTANRYTLNPHSKSRHSLDSWVYSYINVGGNADNIKIEINYSLRSHIYDSVFRPVVTSVTETELMVNTLVPSELFAAKLNALMNRAAVRDLYDINNMIRFGLFDESEYEELRKNTVFYAAISAETINKDFKTDAIDDITFAKVKRDLFPVIAKKDNFDLEQRKESAKLLIRELMNLTDKEKEFLDRFEKKEFKPELVFDDEKIIARLENHPMAIWKMGH
jgi:predicted nucleotidyltransferase component of viral defense system